MQTSERGDRKSHLITNPGQSIYLLRLESLHLQGSAFSTNGLIYKNCLKKREFYANPVRETLTFIFLGMENKGFMCLHN